MYWRGVLFNGILVLWGTYLKVGCAPEPGFNYVVLVAGLSQTLHSFLLSIYLYSVSKFTLLYPSISVYYTVWQTQTPDSRIAQNFYTFILG